MKRFFSLRPPIGATLGLTLGLALTTAPVSSETITVNNTSDPATGVAANCTAASCSLRDAITRAINGNNDVIVFDLPDNSTITLDKTLTVDKNLLTIDGANSANLAISGNNAVRVFRVAPNVEVTFKNFAIKNGFADPSLTIAPLVPQDSCVAESAQSIRVNGKNVVSYVPKGSWFSTNTGVVIVNVESADAATPSFIDIPTAEAVNSCASNSVTGRTVCTTNSDTVYIFEGTTLSNTLTSAATGADNAVTMDARNNRALLSLSPLGGNSHGFQFLDLDTDTLLPPFVAGTFSKGALLDPIHNFILRTYQAGSDAHYQLIDVANPLSPRIFERNTGAPTPLMLGAGADCQTGIALATMWYANPEDTVYIADLTQSLFTPGNPGSWTGPAQSQILTESRVLDGPSGTSAITVAQGTHQGVLSRYESAAITAIQLPSVSGPGTGTPAIADWVMCSISGTPFPNGSTPSTVNTYKSPTTGDAMATFVNANATVMAVVDLTLMLNPAIVPRTSGPGLGHACASGVLPPSVVRFIPMGAL
jgi:hypothetical protein